MQLKETSGRDFIDALEHIFETEGSAEYLGEAVSMAEHMIQTAMTAENNDASEALIAACLLHDIGHFAHVSADNSDWHRKHDEAGAKFLEGHFGAEVIEPAYLHVQAKRYLCAVEPDYFSKLSPPSVHTLEKQGGPMNADEVRVFEAHPYHGEACQLRRWEEQSKAIGVVTRRFSDYRALLERLRIDKPTAP
jgi:predicted HD phosphohydrolase